MATKTNNGLLTLTSPIKQPEDLAPVQAATIPTLAQETPMSTINTKYTTPESSVAQQLASLLKTDSSYITTARKGSQETANQLGLLSSSMAAGAGERAAIQSALPIAQQDAGYYQDIARQQQSIRGQEEIAKEAAKNTAALSAADQTALGAREQQQLKYNLATNQLGNLMKLEELAVGERETYASLVNNIFDSYSSEILSIQQDPNKSVEQKDVAIDGIEYTTKKKVDFINKLYGQNISWTRANWGDQDVAAKVPTPTSIPQIVKSQVA